MSQMNGARDMQGRQWNYRVRKDDFGTSIEVLINGARVAEFDVKPWHELTADGVSVLRWFLPDEEGKRAL